MKFRTVRVFLSSTFRDFAEERDLLVRKVFHDLRRRCRQRQVELVDVDLRWGITEDEAQQGKVLPICLAEIDRARPYFIGFLGERYGWVPKKYEYDESLTSEQTWLEKLRGDKSVTELEMLHGVLNNPAMEDRAFFYFRDPDYSNSKGGAYLSESPEDKAKLEALKDRIRKSGFPVVENYANPEALAECVKEDLWKLIDNAFPESKVPDALDLERRRHEVYCASRQGMYIGGEAYFAALEGAMAAQASKPVLVTGASGGGKSALLANWSRSYSSRHPKTIVLEHYLATGADSAEAIGMVTRLLKEISRITGEDLVLEGDPRKALHLFDEWLRKAGAFARQQGGEFVLVLDGLDKMTGIGGLDWWPHRLPEGVGLVASCLPGLIFDAIANRIAWDQVVVAPLGRKDCQSFINSYLGKFRKPLPPELVALVLQHPLSGNPLFLRTLLEEMRVFGVHEQLKQKLEHYLASKTVDDLFERVLARIEADNRPEDVRALLEVLWAAKESFAEDELLEISGLPPAVWAPIHIALDDSLIGEGGRLLFGHDYLRKAVEDRYLESEKDRRRVRNRMAEFCAQAMAGGRKDISLYVRRHAVEHFLEVEDWDNATASLSDLEFIEARAIAQELPAMLLDYAHAANLLPEGEKERQTESSRQAELDRYAKEMVEYAVAWSRVRDGSGEPELSLPSPVESVRLWTDEEIAAERKRIIEKPNQLDIVVVFQSFVASNTKALQKFCGQVAFAASLASNYSSAGPIWREGMEKLKTFATVRLRRCPAPVSTNSPPAYTSEAVLEGHNGFISALGASFSGDLVVSAGTDAILRIWDVKGTQCLKTIQTPCRKMHAVAVSADGARIASGGNDKAIRIWNPQNGSLVRELLGHENLISSLAIGFDGKMIVSGSKDKSLKIWDAEEGNCIGTINAHWSNSMALSNDANFVFSAGSDKTIRAYDLETMALNWVYEGHEASVLSVVVAADSQTLVSGDLNGVIRIWHPQSGACLGSICAHESGVRALAMTSDGRLLVSAGGQTLRLWDLNNGDCLRVFQGHSNDISGILLSHDGRRMISGSWDGTLRVWNLQHPNFVQDSQRHGRSFCRVSMCSEGKLVSSSDDGVLRLWDSRSGSAIRDLAFDGETMDCLWANSSGREIVAGSQRNVLRLWHVDSGSIASTFPGAGPVASTRDAQRIAFAKPDNTVDVWDREAGKAIATLDGHTDWIESVDMSADGRRIVTSSYDSTLRLWSADSGSCEQVIRFPQGVHPRASISRDGKRVFSWSPSSSLRIWDAQSGACLHRLNGRNDRCAAVLSHDGRSVIFASLEDNKIAVWDVKTGACAAFFGEDLKEAFSIIISPDDRFLLSASLGSNTLRIIDLHGKRCLAVFYLRGIYSIAADWSGKCLAVGFTDGRLDFFGIENLNFGPFVTTVERVNQRTDHAFSALTANPDCCGCRFSVQPHLADKIKRWENQDDEGGYSDPALLTHCPSCGTPLRLNPFFIDARLPTN